MAKQNKLVEDNYEEVTSEITAWKPQVNDYITGKILRRIKSTHGQTFILMNDKGEYFLPNHVVLTALLEKCAIGDNVKIVCTGIEPAKDKGKNDTTLYKVFVKKE